MNVRLIYVLHSGNLYGTEQMALRTVKGLRCDHEAVIVSPGGPLSRLTAELNIVHKVFGSNLQLIRIILTEMAKAKSRGQEVVVIDTGIKQSLVVWLARHLFNLKISHLHVVHGGTSEYLSYSRKKWLAKLGVKLVAISEFVKERLVEHGCNPEQVFLIRNFHSALNLPQRADYHQQPDIKRVAVISRLDPIKRVDMVLAAVEEHPGLSELEFDVYGAGSDLDALRARAAHLPNVRIHGFFPNASHELAKADLLLHTCATEPFGLVLLEAFEAGVLVMAPNRGGASELIEGGVNGLPFAANDSRKMAQVLLEAKSMNPHQVQCLVSNARKSLDSRFSLEAGVVEYRNLIGAQHVSIS